MKRVLIATTLALALAATSIAWAASSQAQPAPDPKLGTRVTITGCLHKGTGGDSFVLLGVTERPADSTAPILPVPYAIYWLDSTDGLKPLVGELVDITGKVTERRAKPGTITVAIDDRNALAEDVRVESGTRHVTSEKFGDTPRPVGTAGSSSLEVTRPVYKLVVEKISPVSVPSAGPACR
jgi:hypothetical protein